MSDKSFGDHSGRNVVKNPLLSTAVVGLSIEDLTHNAVLLPVRPEQVFQTTQVQPITEENKPQTDNTRNAIENEQPNANIKERADDFDVNTYLARLHSTRYVSAPMNATIDANANINASEEGLEEISLTEDVVETQSLTNDIAQNFSQLPTVLPQVANAVFSSFSNMLSSKKEVNHEVSKVVDDQKFASVGFEVANVEGSEVMAAAPLKEPPIGGTTQSYRMTTKKKAYAQIPGLSSGDQMRAPPSFYTPPAATPTYYTHDIQKNPEPQNIVDSAFKNVNVNRNEIDNSKPPMVPPVYNPEVNEDKQNVGSNVAPTFVDGIKRLNLGDAKEVMNIPTPVESNPSIIPPPKMFSNVKSDGNPSRGVLPPSVARRLTSNQPVMKQQPPTSVPMAPNYFVPSDPMIDSSQTSRNIETNYFTPTQPILEISSTDKNKFESSSVQMFPKSLPPKEPSITRPKPENMSTINLEKMATAPDSVQTFFTPESTVGQTSNFETNIFDNQSKTEQFTNQTPARNIMTNPTQIDTATEPPITAEIEPQMFGQSIGETTPYSAIPKPFSQSIVKTSPNSAINAVPIFDPTSAQQTTTGVIKSSPGFLMNVSDTPNTIGQMPPPLFESKPAQPQLVPEPPKLTTAANFRMSKKKPQYYSGPIEGIGSISNNIKPIIPPPNVGPIQANLFTQSNEPFQQPTLDENPQIFVPQTDPNVSANNAIPNPSINTGYFPAQHSNIFDLNSQTSVQAAFDLNQPNAFVQQEHISSTAFDLSRQENESTYQPKQETNVFGLIGSLKSKLSSIDINTIQNKVTTFFDPAYNATTEPQSSQNKPTHPVGVDNNYNPYNEPTGFSIQLGNNSTTDKYTQQSYAIPNTQNINQQYYEQNYGTQPNVTANYFQINPNAQQYPNIGFQQPIPQIDAYGCKSCLPENARKIDEHTHQNFIQSNPVTFEENLHQPSSIFEQTPGAEFKSRLSSNTGPIIPSGVNTSTQAQELNIIDDIVVKNEKVELESFVASRSKKEASKSFISEYNTAVELVSIPQFYTGDNPKEMMQDLETLNLNEEQNINQLFGQNHKNFFDDLSKDTKNVNNGENSSVKPFKLFSNTGNILNESTASIFSPAVSNQCPNLAQTTEYEFKVPQVEQNLDSQNLFGIEKDLQKDPSSFFNDPAVQISNENTNMASYFSYSTEVLTDQDNEDKKSTSFIGEAYDAQRNEKRLSTASQLSPIITAEEANNVNMEQIDDNELNICETCREVNKIDDDDRDLTDLTSQLIENITAPIQLSNPVEVPLTESDLSSDKVDFDTDKMQEEICHITEETIETIHHVQSAEHINEEALLDKNYKTEVNDGAVYGWTDSNKFSIQNILTQDDYTFQPDPKAIGFFSNNSLFFDNIPKNASDEIKAEFKTAQEDTTNASITPTAPILQPEDANVLDVNSIEQDAKTDFQFEEYIIEPSETDDDKIVVKERERYSGDPAQDVDTFTSRIDKFKQKEEIEGNDCSYILQQNVTSPISIASYFDTGNYAAETHYKNSLTSPPNISGLVLSPQQNILQPTLVSTLVNEILEDEPKIEATLNTLIQSPKKVPETQTQTPVTSTATYSTGNLFSKPDLTASYRQIENTCFPARNTELIPKFSTDSSLDTRTNDNHNYCAAEDKDLLANKSEDKAETVTFDDNKTVDPVKFEFKQQVTIGTNIEKDVPVVQHKEPVVDETKNLQDPINFFSSPVETSTDDSVQNFSRLSSYFTTSQNNELAKPFFELSASQNHYRKPTTETATNQGLNRNLDLIRDLTSTAHYTPNNDQKVKTVNYFTVEYDDSTLTKQFEAQYELKDDLNNNLNEANNDINNTNNKKSDKNIEANKSNNTIPNKNSLIINACHICSSKIFDFDDAKINKVDFNSSKANMRKAMDNISGQDGGTVKSDTGSEKSSPIKPVNVTFDIEKDEKKEEHITLVHETRPSGEYASVKHHWFYRIDLDGRSTWRGFSTADSRALEEAFHSPDLNEQTLVPTDGGRYDVNVVGRLRIAVYWSDKPTNVRRCSWFYEGKTDGRYVPYSEAVAERLEEEFRHGVTTGDWHRRLLLPNNETVVMHSPNVMVHFPQSGASDAWTGGAQSSNRSRVVRRGCDESEIEDPEPSSIDHLLLLCHGVGSACDMRFRPVEEVVEDFRATSLQLIQGHYRSSYDNGVVGRVEILPISWHATLHSGEEGVDKRLARVTLDSIPRLRNFTNDTVLDVLFYTSPVYSQMIIDTVCGELNRIYNLFMKRNPSFKGGVSLGGHSLGSVILYDLLCHQDGDPATLSKTYLSGSAQTAAPSVKYPQLVFAPAAMYALGSPIAIFECIRGVESLGETFALPTCKNFYNIFHPYDPIAYRIEPLIRPELKNVPPFLIPHHKGRKRMHLELKETVARVGADIKQKLVESIKATWGSMWKTYPPTTEQLEKVVEEQIEKETLTEENTEEIPQPDNMDANIQALLGKLNGGKRVDYVLQEAPFEMINEYIFAMSSHVGYWESEDTMLLILREIYDSLGVQPDSSLPQNTMTVQRTKTVVSTRDETTLASLSEYPSTSGSPQ